MTTPEILANHGSRLAQLEAGQKRLEARIAELLGEQLPSAEDDGAWKDASGNWRNQAGAIGSPSPSETWTQHYVPPLKGGRYYRGSSPGEAGQK